MTTSTQKRKSSAPTATATLPSKSRRLNTSRKSSKPWPTSVRKTKKIKKVKAGHKTKTMHNDSCMKHKTIKFIDIMTSVRKVGGRASTAFTDKKAKGRSNRHAWKKEELV